MGGDVGSGDEFEADLFYLFMAGKVHMPRTARTYERLAWELERTNLRLSVIASELSNPAGMSGMGDCTQVLKHALGTTAVNVDEAADALVRIALDYAATDEGVNQRFTASREALTGADAADASAADTDPTPPR